MFLKYFLQMFEKLNDLRHSGLLRTFLILSMTFADNPRTFQDIEDMLIEHILVVLEQLMVSVDI